MTDTTPRLPKRAGPAEQETAGSELSGYCERAALARFKRDLLGQHDVSNRKVAYGQETQADLWATVFADLADIRSRSRIDSVAVARVAADHLEITRLRELPPLEGREAMPQHADGPLARRSFVDFSEQHQPATASPDMAMFAFTYDNSPDGERRYALSGAL